MPAGPFKVEMPPDWARPLVDERAFAEEQAALAHTWTFLGMAGDVARDGQWLRASLATRSVFVQRFGTELKGFENRCAHRSFPLRTADRGQGPIVCGFHHWRYDAEGRATGIPMCRELFGTTPDALDARLQRIEVAACGEFVFGRFPAAHATQTLEAFLGDGFPILAALSRMPRTPRFIAREVKANWRLCFHIGIEDYHPVSVHPRTFGKNGYLRRERIAYHRFGDHSAYFTEADPADFERMAAACRAGTWRSKDYRVFHLFPSFTVAHFRSDENFWHIAVVHHAPLARDRSALRAWCYPTPFPTDHAWYQRLARPLADPIRGRIVWHFMKMILDEDNRVCERLQGGAAQIVAAPLLGRLEERIAWFEEAYRKAMAEGASGCGATSD